jgi:hypothetical protein
MQMNDERMMLNYRADLLQYEIEMYGMVAENDHRKIRGEPPAFGEGAFEKLRQDVGRLFDALNKQ